MKKHKVSPLLAYTVQTLVAQRMGTKQHVCQEDVQALQCVSPALLKSLAFQVHGKHLSTERLLGALQCADNGFLKAVCSLDGAFQLHTVEPGQILFLPGEECHQALFLVQGDCTYLRTDETAAPTGSANSVTANLPDEELAVEEVPLSSGGWLAEVCLWVRWWTRGVAEFVSHGEIRALHASGVQEVLGDMRGLAKLARAYSRALADVLRSRATQEKLIDENFHGSAEAASFVLHRLQKDDRLVLSRHALEGMKASHKGYAWQKLRRDLELELCSRKCALLLVSGMPERVVFLSAVSMRSGDK